MKKLIALAAVASLVVATPAMAGGFGKHRGGSDRSLINLDLSDVVEVNDLGILNNSEILNGNSTNILSGILNPQTVVQNNSIPVLSGIGLFSNNKRGGRRW